VLVALACWLVNGTLFIYVCLWYVHGNRVSMHGNRVSMPAIVTQTLPGLFAGCKGSRDCTGRWMRGRGPCGWVQPVLLQHSSGKRSPAQLKPVQQDNGHCIVATRINTLMMCCMQHDARDLAGLQLYLSCYSGELRHGSAYVC
jgi:hypothetical protein